MKTIIKRLKMVYWAITLSLALIALCIELLLMDTNGGFVDNPSVEFVYQSVATLMTLAGVYVCLRFFKFGLVVHSLQTNVLNQYLTWSVWRLVIIEFMVLTNLMGYLAFVSASFAWLAVIAAMSLFFVYPSADRFLGETDLTEEEVAKLETENSHED